MGGETPPSGWVRVTYQRPAKKGSRQGSGWLRWQSGDTPERIADRLRSFIPDAYGVEAAIPVVSRADTPKTAVPAGFATIDRAAVMVAVAVAREPHWWQLVPPRQKFYERRRSRAAHT